MTVPIGTILPYAGTSAPAEYLLCYGQAIGRTTYAPLFAVIGTTYGSGDGSTTFNVPDLRGRVPAGKDDMGGTSANRVTTGGSGIDGSTLGTAGGEQNHTLTTGELATHTHTGMTDSDGAHSHTINLDDASSGAVPALKSSVGDTFVAGPTDVGMTIAGLHTHDITMNNTGSGDPHNNMQPTLIANYIIYVGTEISTYVTEDGADTYVTEDGANIYVAE